MYIYLNFVSSNFNDKFASIMSASIILVHFIVIINVLCAIITRVLRWPHFGVFWGWNINAFIMATVNFPFEAVDVSSAYNRGVQPMSECLLEISVSSEGDRKGYREGKRQRNRICWSSWVEVRVQSSKRWKWATEKVKVRIRKINGNWQWNYF